ncbi:MAG TPA: alkaline phosphatase PafA [Flavisolibacter sp.]|nr:alkaline phosphatase PafA [Flavisolibacter sp.]
MKRVFVLWILMVSVVSSFAQPTNRPRLVIGLMIDQMRTDYLYRYYDRYSNNGFKRLLREGFNCDNTFIPYTPTVTGAGHACVYTGSVPALNGIISNSWYDEQQRRVVYCAEDSSVRSVGSNSVAGRMSPKNMWSNTITDELRLATNFKSKTIGIALKDRGAILPAGHSATGAYWFDNASGGWITSTYYMNQLPDWLNKFNGKKLPDTYLKENWNTLYPINTYKQSTADSNAYESKLPGEDYTFPHITANITTNRYESFRYLPAATTYTLEMAKAAIDGEKLGKRSVTDFLAVSLSTPDYAGHAFAPNSIEIEDTYLRLDRDIANFLNHLDVTIGKGQYLLFLTSDHGAAYNPVFLHDNKMPGGIYDNASMRRKLNDTLEKVFNTRALIEQTINYNIYLNDSVIRVNNLDRKAVKQFISEYLIKVPGVTYVVDLADLSNQTVQQKVKWMLTNGYNQKLSGDLQVVVNPNWLESWRTGTTHSAWNPYDSRIPLIWFGWNVKSGKTNREVYMSDIAPTLAAMLNIQMPNASIGTVIQEVVK